MAAAAVLAVMVTAFVVVRMVILDDSATRVDADSALDNYRASTTSEPTDATEPTPDTAASTSVAPTPVPELPAPGVYAYATTGTESVDALGGASHDYPAETYLTVTGDGCGVRLRWDLLEERRDEWALCADERGVWLQPDTVDWHAFFGQGELVTTDCTDPALIVPQPAPGATPLAPTAMTCTRRDGVWNHEWQVLGTESQQVAGQTVLTVHSRLSIEIDTETTVIDWWMTPSGLPVLMTSSKESSTETVAGTIVYRETYMAELVSLEPMN
jgi:hypothetical protein